MIYDPVFLAARKAAGGGKNLFRRDYEKTETTNGVTFWWDSATQEVWMNGTVTGQGDLKIVNPMQLDWEAGEKYTCSVRHTGGSAKLPDGATGNNYAWGIFQSNAAKYVRGTLGLTEFPEVYSFTGTAFELDENKTLIFYFQCWKPGTTFDNYRVRVQVEKGTTFTDWAPYSKQMSRKEMLTRFKFLWRWLYGGE